MNVLDVVCVATESLMVSKGLAVAALNRDGRLACHVTGLFYDRSPTQPAVETTREGPAKLPNPCACIVPVLDNKPQPVFYGVVEDA